MTRAIIIDTETTDSDTETLEVVEVAWKPFDFAGTPSVSLVNRFGHANPMRWGALAVHHILPMELTGFERFKGKEDCPKPFESEYWIGHNVDFDWKAMGSPKGVKRIDTLAMARAVHPQMDSHTLTAMTYFVLGATPKTRDALRSAHSAETDIAHCEVLLRHLIDVAKVEPNLYELWRFSEECRVPTMMTFGKFRGQPITDVDRGYANWYRRQPDPDPYLLEAFRRCGLI